MVSSSGGRDSGHDDAALDEIDLAGELMIAANTSSGERLPTERIDEVLLDRPDRRAADRPGTLPGSTLPGSTLPGSTLPSPGRAPDES